MLRTLRPALAALFVVAAVLALAPAAQAQIAVVSVKSVDDVLSDVKYFMTLAGQGDRARELDGLITALTGGQGFKGIDTKRPLGVYVNAPKGGRMPEVVVFVPVTKEGDLLGLLAGFNIEAKKDKDLHVVALPNGETVYLKFANNYVYGSNSDTVLGGKLPDPTTVIPKTGPNTHIAATVRIDQIPKEYKDKALEEMKKGLAREEEKKPGESEAEHRARLAGMKIAAEAFTTIVNDSQELTFNLEIDQKQHNVALDLALKAKDGSALAKSFNSFGAGRSMFSGLAKDSMMNLLLYIPLADELRNQFGKALEEGFKEALAKEKDPQKKALAEKFFKTLEPTLKSEVIDVAFAVHPAKDKKIAVVGGFKVKDGKKIEQMVRDVIKDLPANEKKQFTLDKEKVGGLSVHHIKPDEPLDDEAEKVLGSNDVYVAFRDDAVLVSVGQHGLDAMKSAVAALAQPAAKVGAPVQFEISVAKFAPLIPGPEQEKIAAAITKTFVGADKDKDKVRLSVQGGAGSARLRLDIDAQIVKLAAALNPEDN